MKAVDAKELAEKALAKPWTEPYLEAIHKKIRKVAALGGLSLKDPMFLVPLAVLKLRPERGDMRQVWEGLKEEGYTVTHGKHAWETVVSWERVNRQDAKDAKF